VASWVDHVIWWQVYPLGFVGAEGERVNRVAEPHRLRRLEGWLDHLIALGCNGLLLGPVFSSSTHGCEVLEASSPLADTAVPPHAWAVLAG
jgi:cyclomaltodextrinase / maltogenic alpha-amylase / neopullulanase